MRAVSLFSGVGGFEIGFEKAGIETILQAEKDQLCLQVLERHWPNTKKVYDVKDVNSTSVNNIDLVYGGFPCQDLSMSGKRAGIRGDRSGLWFEFNRVLRELRPRWAVIENVPGVLSSDKGRDFGIILQGLEECGFGGISWAILDAQYFGVPQRRRRVFIVAGPTRRSTESVLHICESCSGDIKQSKEKKQEIAGEIDRCSYGDINKKDVINKIWKDPTFIARPLGASTNGHRKDLDGTYVLATVRMSQTGANGIGVSTDGLAYTLDQSLQQAIHSDGVRRLTPIECERLMGWPEEWTKFTANGETIADTHRYKMTGNGVVSNIAEWIGNRLVKEDTILGATVA